MSELALREARLGAIWCLAVLVVLLAA